MGPGRIAGSSSVELADVRGVSARLPPDWTFGSSAVRHESVRHRCPFAAGVLVVGGNESEQGGLNHEWTRIYVNGRGQNRTQKRQLGPPMSQSSRRPGRKQRERHSLIETERWVPPPGPGFLFFIGVFGVLCGEPIGGFQGERREAVCRGPKDVSSMPLVPDDHPHSLLAFHSRSFAVRRPCGGGGCGGGLPFNGEHRALRHVAWGSWAGGWQWGWVFVVRD